MSTNRARLFATHYHELTALSAKLDGVENATVTVKEWEGEVVFLHEVHKGAADRSYGVQVAQLAGLPAAVIARARVVLDILEKGEREGGAGQKSPHRRLAACFQRTPAPPPMVAKPSPAIDMLGDIHPDESDPARAL